MHVFKTNAHDGKHIDNYRSSFEWWYFDFDIMNDYHLHIEWHAPIFNLRDNYCMLIVRLHCNKKKGFEESKSKFPIIHTYRYKRNLVSINDGRCEIRFPAGEIYEKNNYYNLWIEEKDLSIAIRMRRKLPFVIQDRGLLLQNNRLKENFYWNSVTAFN